MIEVRTARRAMEIAKPCPDESCEVLRGYAATFNQPYDMGEFHELVAPGAFRESLGSGDIVALVNHDSARPLARLSRGNLQLSEDDRGLRVEIDPIDTTYARDLMTAVRAGVVDAMSFGFQVKRDTFEQRDGKTYRTLHDVELHEVSVVTFPANPNADVQLDRRSLERWLRPDAWDAELAAPATKLRRFFLLPPR